MLAAAPDRTLARATARTQADRAGALRGVRGPAVLPGPRLDRDAPRPSCRPRRPPHRGARGPRDGHGIHRDHRRPRRRRPARPAGRHGAGRARGGRARGARGRRPLRRQGRCCCATSCSASRCPDGFLERHPEARASATEATAARQATRPKRMRDYPQRSTVMSTDRVQAQVRTYWCGPTTMQMIAWGWSGEKRKQQHWARRLGTTTSGSAITDMVRVVNQDTGWDRADRAGRLHRARHLRLELQAVDAAADAARRGLPRPAGAAPDPAQALLPLPRRRRLGSLPGRARLRQERRQARRHRLLRAVEPAALRPAPSRTSSRVQWRSAYKSFRANKAHFQQNIGV